MELSVSHGLDKARQLITDFLQKNTEYQKVRWEQHWLTVLMKPMPGTPTQYMAIEDIWHHDRDKKAVLIKLEEVLFAAEHEACDCTTLDELLACHECNGKNFRPGAFYNADGDMLEVCWSNESDYGSELKGRHGYSTMCLMKAQEGDLPVGVKVYDLKLILKEVGLKIVPI
jgi:hypothetical protein